MRILVTSAGSTAAQNLLLAIRERDLERRWFTVSADADAVHGGLGLADLELVVPRGDRPGYVEEIARLARRHGLRMVVPVFAPELLALSEGGEGSLPKGCTLLVSPRAAIETCLSKRRLAGALHAAGVAAPGIVETPAERELPLFVRPDSGTGSVAARRIDRPSELAAELARDPGLVATRVLAGEEFSVDGFAWPAGKLVHAVCRRRDRVRNGLVVRSTVVPGAEARILATRVASALPLAGFFNLQFFATPKGPVVFDVNPRLGGGMILSFAAGLDPLRCLTIAAGGPPGIEPWSEQVGLELVRRWHNLFLGGSRPDPADA